MFDHLFREGRIGKLRTKNRIFLAPMVRNYADAEGRATDRYVAHIERIARGGVGVMTLEASYVGADGKGFRHQLGLHEDSVLPGLRRLVAAAHRHGALIGPQLFHAGRQTASATTGLPLLAPSPIPCPLERETPRQMTEADITRVVGQFGDAAARAAAAGCDYVEIHGAHGYLITQFLSGFSNARSDGYGGSLDNRMRFLHEVYAAVRSKVGPDFPVLVRLSGEEGVEGGLTIEDTVEIARSLEARGADGLHISCGNYGSYTSGRMIAPMSMPDGLLSDLAERVRMAVSVPVIAVGKIRTPEMAEELLALGVADFIALGRPLLADPDWPEKARAGELAAINRCIACNEGCISRLFAQKDAWCLVNPEAGRELEFANTPSGPARRVMVVGGGPGGMTAAHMAKRAGHDVTLYERSDRLGGTLFAAGAAPYRQGWTELRRHLTWVLRQEGVTIHCGKAVSADFVRSQNPDVVILATGALPREAPWISTSGLAVVSAIDVLDGREIPRGRVVVAGGGCSGAQTAEFIAERGLPVTLIEESGEIASDAPMDERALLLRRLKRSVLLMTDTVITGAADGQVRASGRHGALTVPCDTLVICFGSQADDRLAAALKGIGAHVISVGDCASPRQVLEAIAEGARAGFHLELAELDAQAA